MLNVISGAFLAGSTNIGEFIFFSFVAGMGAFSILAAVPVCLIRSSRGMFADIVTDLDVIQPSNLVLDSFCLV